jgi:hypothetical protein
MWKILLLLTIIHSANGEFAFEMPNYGSALTEAVVDIVTNFYMNKSTTVNIFHASKSDVGLDEIEDVMNEIFYLLKDKIVVQIEEYSQMKISKDKKWHNIMFCDSYESFMKIFSKMDPESFEYQGFYLIAISKYNDGIYEMMNKIFEALWIQQIVNVNIVWMPSENYREVLMWTYWPYSSSYCGKAVPLQHNHYRGGKWLRSVEFFPNKMTNFHGNCCLKLSIF